MHRPISAIAFYSKCNAIDAIGELHMRRDELSIETYRGPLEVAVSMRRSAMARMLVLQMHRSARRMQMHQLTDDACFRFRRNTAVCAVQKVELVCTSYRVTCSSHVSHQEYVWDTTLRIAMVYDREMTNVLVMRTAYARMGTNPHRFTHITHARVACTKGNDECKIVGMYWYKH